MGGGRKTAHFHACPYVVLYIMCVIYVHNPESARTILRTRLKKTGNSDLGIRHRRGRFVRKRLHILRPKERNLGLYATYLVNSCQGKEAGVLFILNYSIHAGIGCDKSS